MHVAPSGSTGAWANRPSTMRPMPVDGPSLNLAAAVCSTVASVFTLATARGSRSAMLAGALGLVSSVAWTAAAYHDYTESRAATA